METAESSLSKELLALLILIAVAFVGLFFVLPNDIVPVLAAFTAVVAVYFGVATLLARYQSLTPDWLNTAPAWLVFLFPVIVVIALLARFWADASLVAIAFVLALMAIFLYYWLIVPLALVQKLEQMGWKEEVTDWPDISVLVPAYKERGFIARLLDSIAAAEYPAAVELIVIDDGSLDGTFEEAKAHVGTNATVIQKENGGKHSALNRGLVEASHDVIVSIDADCWIGTDSLKKLVQEFERHPGAGAIAGNVKVGNRGSFVTKLQSLEYIVGINTFRRAFDHVGLVSVVPGSFGAFRRRTLEEIEGYSSDTLTEDFDLTIEILKRGEAVHASEGIVYTHAPETWRGLYRQRLRWYRGNIQTLKKHVNVFTDRKYKLLHRIVFPYALFSLTLLPLFGIVALGVIPFAIRAGEVTLLVQTGAFFLVLIVLLSLLAVEIDGERRWHVLLAPFSIIGYKQFLDVILLRSIVDVFSGRRLHWTSAGQVERSGYGSSTGHSGTETKWTSIVEKPVGGDDDRRFEIQRDGDGRTRWRFLDADGDVLATSAAGYDSEADAREAIDHLAAVAREADTLDYDPAGFEVYRDDQNEWYWQLRSRNGRLLARSHHGYESRGSANEAVEHVREYVATDERWSVTVGERGGYHWRLTAPNGTVLGRNVRRFDREGQARESIERVREVAPAADTLEYDPAGYEVFVDSGGSWRWRLQHRSGRVLANGTKGYPSRSDVRAAVQSLQQTMPSRPSDD